MLHGGRLATRCAPLVAAVFCLAADPPKTSEPERVWYVDAGDTALDYRVPSSACPSEQDFRVRVADLYGFDDPFVPNGIRAHTLIRIDVAKTQIGYRGIIFVIDPTTGEVLRQSSEEEQTSCDYLMWVLSHRMRMIISPKPHPRDAEPAKDTRKDDEIRRRLDAVEEAIEDQDETIKELRAKIAALQRALAEEKKRKMDLTYALSAGAFITANLTSNVGPGVWVGGELRAGPLALGLELRTVIPSRMVLGPYDYDLSQYVALLTPCGRYSYFFGCAVAGAGMQLVYDSNHPTGEKTGFDPAIQLGGRLGAELPFGESMLAGRVWGEVLYTTPGTEVTIDPYKSVRPDVSAFFGLGLVIKFGKEGD